MGDSFEKMKQYGKIGLITHFAISWTFFAGLYLVIHKAGKTQKIIDYFKLTNKIPQKAGSFVISGIIYKAIMPVRIGFSLFVIPFVISYQQDSQII